MTVINASHDCWVLVVTPRRSMAIEAVSILRKFPKFGGMSIGIGDNSNALVREKGHSIRMVTSSNLLAALAQRHPHSQLTGLDLVVCESLEHLDTIYELAVSLLRHATQTQSTRFVGFSNSLHDPADLADWLDVDPCALHSFRPSDRGQALAYSIQSFSIPHSSSLFKAMAKPAHAAIKLGDPSETAIVFVATSSLCRTVGLDLLTQCSLESETKRGYLSSGISEDHLEHQLARVQDHTLQDFVSRGVGFFHLGISKPDRNLMLELYAEGIIRVFIVPRESCWTSPLRASVVVVMGTQYSYSESESSERQIRDYGLPELVQMQGRAVRHGSTGHFHLFCQSEARDTLTRFLNEGLPLESRLLETQDLEIWYKYQRSRGWIVDRQQAVDALSFTFLARRVVTNPAYYDVSSTSVDASLSRIADRLETRVTPDNIGGSIDS